MTSVSTPLSLRELALADLQAELASTRRILDRVPDDKLSWRPHAKSRTLQELAAHVAQLPGFALTMLIAPELDLAKPRERPADPDSHDALLAAFDKVAARLTDTLADASDDFLREEWTLRAGDRIILRAPRVNALRTMGISHLVHHRGQLSVYLRLLDVPVPGLYGPSADERGS